MDEIVQEDLLHSIDTLTSILAHLSVVGAAIAAVIKFQVLQMFSRRYKSELECRHQSLSDGQIIFEADYTISNTGNRPIDFSGVSLQLCAAETDKNGLLTPMQERTFARRVLEGKADEDKASLHIEAGERSIVTLRTKLPSLDPVTFVLCQLSWNHKRKPARYNGLYVRSDIATSRTAGASK